MPTANKGVLVKWYVRLPPLGDGPKCLVVVMVLL